MGVTVTHPGPEGHLSFFVALTPTRADWPTAMTVDELTALSGHAESLASLAAQGICVVAGPCLDAGLGVGVFDGWPLEQLVRHLGEDDPMVVAGFFDASVRAMKLSFERASTETDHR
ncbi:MAG: hypothetical protein JWO22_3621 [Frankiales bacterium]|nr:hypothetical protein [Frankiales bacterium]